MKLVMSVADRIVVLNFGRRSPRGPPRRSSAIPAVVAAYLGTSAEEAEAELDCTPAGAARSSTTDRGRPPAGEEEP